MIAVVLLLVCAAIGAGAFYWLMFFTEGAYLGPRVVTFLYDRGASTYDRVKEFDPVDDAWDLARPLQRELKSVSKPLILDLATGTGRLPVALLRCLDFEGNIVGLDLSLKMLEQARRKTAGHNERVTLLWKDGLALPFLDGTLDAVCCVEALEFMPEPQTVLREMARVLRPGGILLTTNRVGLDALLMPGRTFSNQRLKALLASVSLHEVEIKKWQTYYDLVWAQKDGELATEANGRELRDVFCCPRCAEASVVFGTAMLTCTGCGARYPVRRGIIMLQKPLNGIRSG